MRSIHDPVAATTPSLTTVQVIVAGSPARADAGPLTAVTRRSGRSASVTSTGKEPALKPAAEATTEADCVRSATPSATPRIVKAAESDPAGIVTVTGTATSETSVVERTTSRGASVAVLRITRPSMAPPSRTDTAAAVTTSDGPSLSSRVSVAEAVPASRTTPEVVVGCAAMTTLRAPVARASSATLVANDTAAALAGIVTVAGMLTAPWRLESSVTVCGDPVTTARVTVPIVAGLPCPSVIVVALNDSASETTSSSVTTTLADAAAIVSAVAVKATRADPSTAALSSAVIGKVTDAAPAGIVTLAGARARDGASLCSLTTRSEVVGVLRVTVPVAAVPAAFSATLVASIDTESRATSSSSSEPASVAPRKPVAEAAIEKARCPWETASSSAPTANCTAAWPAGIVTRAGRPTPSGRLPASSTRRSADVSPLRDRVAVAAEAPSASENRIRESASCSAATTAVGAAAMETSSAVPGSWKERPAPDSTTKRTSPPTKAGIVTAISRVSEAPAASVPSKASDASQRSSPGAPSEERKTRSDQGPRAAASPWLLTVQRTVTVSPGRAEAGAVTPVTARSA